MSKKTRVFVSSGMADLATIRRVLTQLGVEVSDAFDVDQVGSHSVLQRIRESDFAVVAANSATANTWLELGICQGLAKPVLIVADTDVSLPPLLSEQMQLRTSSFDTDLFRRTVTRLVEDLRSKRKVDRPATPSLEVPYVDRREVEAVVRQIHLARAAAPAEAVEVIAARLLAAAAVSAVEKDPTVRDRGADFAIWSTGLQRTIGNPILVEVKAGHLTSARVIEAERRLLSQIDKARAGAGLLLYLDQKDKRFPERRGTPSLLIFDLEDFAKALLDAPFAKVMLHRRSEVVHGIAR